MKEEKEEDLKMKAMKEMKEWNLENRVTSLEKAVNILTVLCNEYAKRNGIKVERFQNGLVVISQM